jgi:hypothetical protein
MTQITFITKKPGDVLRVLGGVVSEEEDEDFVVAVDVWDFGVALAEFQDQEAEEGDFEVALEGEGIILTTNGFGKKRGIVCRCTNEN